MEQQAIALTPADQKRLLHLILDLGEQMLQSGAEINRVEDTLTRVGNAYGAVMNVFVIIYSIVITMTFPDHTERTQTRRVQNSMEIDFDRLERLNDLSRRCCREPMEMDELSAELQRIGQIRWHHWKSYAGNMLGAFSFAVFFGGTAADGLLSALFAVLIVVIQHTIGRICPNRIIFNLIISVVTGAGIGLVSRLLPGTNMDMIMIGDIMLLNPGVTMVNAVREMMVGNMISGQMRFAESLMLAAALAGGFMLALAII